MAGDCNKFGNKQTLKTMQNTNPKQSKRCKHTARLEEGGHGITEHDVPVADATTAAHTTTASTMVLVACITDGPATISNAGI
jgi:hypothetical protein